MKWNKINFENMCIAHEICLIAKRKSNDTIESKIIDTVDKDYLGCVEVCSIGGLKSPFSADKCFYNPNRLFYVREVNYPESDYQEVDISFLIEFLERVKSIDYKNLSEHDIYLILYNLFENYFSYSSVNGHEVSFFEQTKLRAGLSSAICLCMQEEDSSKSLSNLLKEEKMLIACSFDFLGIKDFKFSNANTSSLKHETAASLFVDLFRENVLDCFLEEIGLTRCNLIFSGGRHLHMYLPNHENIVGYIKSYIEKVNDWLVENFGTAMYVSYGIAPIHRLGISEQRNADFYLNIFTQIANDKAKMESHMYTAKNISVMNEGVKINEKIVCDIEMMATEGQFLDFQISDKRYCLKEVLAKKDVPAISIWYQPIYMGSADVYRDEMSVLRLDIDNFRTFMLSNHSGEIEPFKKMELSKNFSMFLRRDVAILLDRFSKEGKDNCVIHEGADDMFIVAPKNVMWEIAICLEEHYRRFTRGGVTFSAGLSEFIQSCNFADNCALAQQLMDKAKTVPNKDAIVWKDDRNQMKWADFIKYDENCKSIF